MKKRDIVRSYLTNEEYESLSIRAMARLICLEHPDLFKDVDNCRLEIRCLIGSAGDRRRNELSDKIIERDVVGNMNERGFKNYMNKYNLPESDEQANEPLMIQEAGVYALLSDIHVPYHNVQALEIAFDYMKQHTLKGIILNGDILDFYQLSRYSKDPRKRSFADELEAGYALLCIMAEQFGCKITYKIGNHEERYEHFMAARAPELLGVAAFKIEELLHTDTIGAEVVKDKRMIKLGKLSVLHGHEFGQSIFSPVNPARGYYLRAKASVICGHNHQTSNHVENNLEGDIVSTWSTGCLSELKPAYMPYNKWNHGFAMVEVFDDGTYEVENLKIIKGKIR